jgi:hypothetical protein
MADRAGASSGVKTACAILAGLLVIVGAIVVATTGDSWAVRMTLTVVTLDVAIRLFRWSRGDAR